MRVNKTPGPNCNDSVQCIKPLTLLSQVDTHLAQSVKVLYAGSVIADAAIRVPVGGEMERFFQSLSSFASILFRRKIEAEVQKFKHYIGGSCRICGVCESKVFRFRCSSLTHVRKTVLSRYPRKKMCLSYACLKTTHPRKVTCGKEGEI